MSRLHERNREREREGRTRKGKGKGKIGLLYGFIYKGIFNLSLIRQCLSGLWNALRNNQGLAQLSTAKTIMDTARVLVKRPEAPSGAGASSGALHNFSNSPQKSNEGSYKHEAKSSVQAFLAFPSVQLSGYQVQKLVVLRPFSSQRPV